MIKKSYTKNGGSCRVTFVLPNEVNAKTAYLCGDFTEWEKSCQLMKQQKDGSFKLTISLTPGQEYRFRYLLDNDRWENDGAADAYLPNPFGTEDCVVRV
jgi:1,4-alpha-glucan branching enzyme